MLIVINIIEVSNCYIIIPRQYVSGYDQRCFVCVLSDVMACSETCCVIAWIQHLSERGYLSESKETIKLAIGLVSDN